MRTALRLVGAALSVFAALTAVEAQQAEPRRIATAPAFNARALTSSPTKDWITNGGNVFNQRYSPLTVLDRANVEPRGNRGMLFLEALGHLHGLGLMS